MSSRKKAAIKKAKAGNRQIALERIELLFKEARKAFSEHPERANRYVDLARKIGMRYRVQIPTKLKRKFCKSCHHYLVQGKNCKVRLKSGVRLVICADCGSLMRYPYRKKKSL